MTPIKAHFDGTAVILDEPAMLSVGQEVLVLVEAEPTLKRRPVRPPLSGFAKGTFDVRADFDEPLDEFAEYR